MALSHHRWSRRALCARHETQHRSTRTPTCPTRSVLGSPRGRSRRRQAHETPVRRHLPGLRRGAGRPGRGDLRTDDEDRPLPRLLPRWRPTAAPGLPRAPAGRGGRSAPVTRPDPIDPGTPGASARREYERRQAARETRIREKHPKLGGLILAVTDEPQSTKAWDTGAIGEERLGQKLNELAGDTLGILHDRRIPGTRANIDHIAVTPSGVFVIDPKRYAGRPTLRVEGGILRPRTEKLLVGGRDRTKLVDGVLKQVDVVRSIVGTDVPVTGVLCFIDADWPLIGGAFTTAEWTSCGRRSSTRA